MNKPVPLEVISYLQSLKPGFIPHDLFYALTRLTVSSILELVPLRRQNESIEVLMLQRPADDPNWPYLFHTPGTWIRATDTEFTLESAFERLFQDEMGGKPTSSPFFVQTLFHRVNRGMESALIYGVSLSSDDIPPSKGTWFPVDQIPENSVDSQHEFIAEAARAFSRMKA